MTRYMFLIYNDESALADMTPELWAQMLEQHQAWQRTVADAGAAVVSGEALAPSATATTVDTATGAPVVTDGPFVETKEALGGYYLVDCADLDQALALATSLPAWHVEVRPVVPTA